MRILLHLHYHAGVREVLESLFLDVDSVFALKQIHERKVAFVAAGPAVRFSEVLTLVRVTFAPGSAAPVGSVTVPETEP